MVKAYPIYVGRKQRGYGIGGLLKKNLKRGIVSVGKRALQAGADAINQASTSNVSFKKALKQQAKNQVKSAISDVINTNSKKQKPSIKNISSVLSTPSQKKRKVNKKSKKKEE